jgi:hypothetical protein
VNNWLGWAKRCAGAILKAWDSTAFNGLTVGDGKVAHLPAFLFNKAYIYRRRSDLNMRRPELDFKSSDKDVHFISTGFS